MAQERIKILAIDDIQDNLLILQAVINDTFENAIFFTALSGPKGIELAKSINPDVILLDIVMPVMDGYQVCEILKKDNTLNEIPVVFVTANKDDKESRIRALDVGAEAFLSKPIDESELIAQIRAMHKVRKANLQKVNENKRLEALVADKTMELNTTIAVLKHEKDLTQKYLNDLILAGKIFENSIENAPIPIMIHAEDGTVLNISQNWTKLTNYTKSDIPTIFDWTKKAYGKNKDEVHDCIRKLYKLTETQHDSELVVTTKDGRQLIWDFNSRYIGDLPDGKAVVMSVATDLTERICVLQL
ncbi:MULTISPECIES: response regulator [Psychrilyobacter]|uniref:response regulator n=1 Tax=Psychrilyobacter TaxID=623282 RepID=UPI0013148A25|nr:MULTISPECIES: response regulator [Psychrilyobacter]MCS5423089.1 response regulator [Psychrilyobacter sp. S5]NDI79290.1 response regulator [Psychrilyobacter piezotolerans]